MQNPICSEDSSTNSNRIPSLLIIAVAVAIHLAGLLNAQPLQSANDRSRWCTVWSLVERGTFQIDEIRRRPGWDSIDIIHDNGHFYSTKPPLLTVMVAGLTWCLCRVTGWSLLDQTHSVTSSVLFIINILPFAISLWLLDAILQRHTRTQWCRLFILLTAAFGTLLTPFLMTFNNHTVAASGVMVSLYCLIMILDSGAQASANPSENGNGGNASTVTSNGRLFGLCGLAAAWTCANELPAGAFGLATFLLAMRRSPKQTLLWYVPAAMVPLIAMIAVNFVATGTWKPTYASYGSSKYNFVIDGVPSYWMNPQGVDRNLDSPLVYLVHCTVGHHGIWSLSPVFLLAVVGWLQVRRIANAALKSVMLCGALLTLVVLTFYLTRTQNYNYGGVSCALRWSLWLTPFWLLSLIPTIDSMNFRTMQKCVQSLLLMASVASAWLPVPNPWQQPWLFQVMEARGWINYRQEPTPLPRPLWTWFASLPVMQKQEAEAVWIEFTSQTPSGTDRVLRMTCHNENDSTQGRLIALTVTETNPARVRQFLINKERFDSGAPPAEFLTWKKGSATPDEKLDDLTFVRGLPLKKEYSPGVVRYLKTPASKNALKCQRAAAQVMHSPHKNSPSLRFRCDVWLCEGVPFGVAQFERQVTSADNSAVLYHERWTISACHPSLSPPSVVPQDE